MNRKLRLKIVEVFDSQANFATASGINQTIISNVIRNRRKPSPRMKERFSRLLQSDQEELFPEPSE